MNIQESLRFLLTQQEKRGLKPSVDITLKAHFELDGWSVGDYGNERQSLLGAIESSIIDLIENKRADGEDDQLANIDELFSDGEYPDLRVINICGTVDKYAVLVENELDKWMLVADESSEENDIEHTLGNILVAIKKTEGKQEVA